MNDDSNGRSYELPQGTLLRHNATKALVVYEYSQTFPYGGESEEMILHHVGRVLAVGHQLDQETGEVVTVGKLMAVLAYPAAQWQSVE